MPWMPRPDLDALDVLLVDDERYALDAQHRALRMLRPRWNLRYATTTSTALALLEVKAPHVVVTDLAMEDAVDKGHDLLAHLMRHQPWVVRVILSGMVDAWLLIESKKWAHRHICKPCPAAKLAEHIEAAVDGFWREQEPAKPG